jgi:rhamnogalacturonan endolyase
MPLPFIVRRAVFRACVVALSLASSAPLFAAFGLSATPQHCVVDTGAGLVFKVDRHHGGIPSLVWNGTELNSWNKPSGLASGLGVTGTSVSARADAETVVVTVTTDATNGVVAGLTHYYIARKGENTLYLATYATKEPQIGELRWITRLQGSLFPSVPAESETRKSTRTIESKDVTADDAGITYSKFYGNQQAKDLTLRGITGPGRGVFMAYGTRESASGGPFFRDIQNQTGPEAEVYNYMNSGHNQTEDYRVGVLHGPYALCFTTGATPPAPDFGFVSKLGLLGYVGAEDRGRVTLLGLEGRDPSAPYHLGFANAAAQYWTPVAADGSANCENLKAGDYTMTVYKRELPLFTASVTVRAAATTTLAPCLITTDPSTTPTLWRVGDWDGTPLEFLNGDTFVTRHPSDSRNAPWTQPPHAVTDRADRFPAAVWRGVNNPVRLTFHLTREQIAARTLRIGLTASGYSARPQINVNAWSSTIPPTPPTRRSRSLTVGTYCGDKLTYAFQIPATAFVVGLNTLVIHSVSGSAGAGFTSPGFSFDCIDLL